MDRNSAIEGFLKQANIGSFERIKIPGDASFRHYERIITEKENYILMDAPPEKEDVKPFIKIDEILINLGFSAPLIISKDIANGFLLLEDLGDNKFNHIFRNNPESEKPLYKIAVDLLIEIYKKRKIFDIPEYSKEKLLSEAMLFPDWYLPLFGNKNVDELKALSQNYADVINLTINRLRLSNNVIVLRDYHADNLMLLDKRSNAKKVGLLDFQDALIGNAAYDLVSLLEDARRDVSEDIQREMLEYFIKGANLNKNDFINDYHILGAQRNLKIIGIFSRLKVRDKKDVYLPMIPRVKNYLKKDLQHESLKELKQFLENQCDL